MDNHIAKLLDVGCQSQSMEVILLDHDSHVLYRQGARIWHQADQDSSCFHCDESKAMNCEHCPIRKTIALVRAGHSPVNVDGSLPSGDRTETRWRDVRVTGTMGAENTVFITIYDVSDYVERERKHLIQGARFTQIGKRASMLLHDLKNPLGVLTGVADLFEMDIATLRESGGDAEELEDNLSMLRESSQKIQSMVKELTDFAAGRERSKGAASINLKNWLQGLLPTPPQAIDLRLNIPSSLTITVDKDKLSDVLWNLVKNSIEALGETSGNITVTATETDSDIHISVSDTGPGLPEIVKNNLFSPGITAGKADGHGFGLSSVKEILTSLNGTIDIDPRRSVGTEFRIALPREAAES